MIERKYVMLYIFIVLGVLAIYSNTVLTNNRCCEFEKAEIDGVISYVSFGKTGNVFSLKVEPEKRYYFFNNKHRDGYHAKDFGEIVKPGFRIVKSSFSKDLIVFDKNNKENIFEIENCCE